MLSIIITTQLQWIIYGSTSASSVPANGGKFGDHCLGSVSRGDMTSLLGDYVFTIESGKHS